MSNKISKFPTSYSDRGRFHAAAGSRFKPTYKMSVDEDGKRSLKVVGKVDLYAEIQSYKDSCDINYILERFANGDQTALSRVQGIYGDFSQMPTTYAELSQRVIDAENLFNSLPLEVRQQFNFSPSEFFAAIGTEKYNDLFGIEQGIDGELTPTGKEPISAEPAGTAGSEPAAGGTEGGTE